MILRRSNCGLQNDIRDAMEKKLSLNRRCSFAATLVFLGMSIQCSDNVYAATNDKLDVNLNVIYLGTRTQKDANALSEGVIQFPFPLTKHSRDTGQGLFGGITYIDNKVIVSNETELMSQFGIGRVYYSYSVPGETPYTFVPFVTLYRDFWYSYKDIANANAKIRGTTLMLPGVMYAYRLDERFALHFDMELYSYSDVTNNRARMGFSYSPTWPWIISVSHERLVWNVSQEGVAVDGNTRALNVKIIFRDPPQGNFALTLGYGNENRHAFGPALLNPGVNNSGGMYFGVEASAGVLAW